MKNINLLLPNPLLIYHEKFSPRIADQIVFDILWIRRLIEGIHGGNHTVFKDMKAGI